MLDDQEARQVLRDHGLEPPARGQLGKEWREQAEDLHAQTTMEEDQGAQTGPAADGAAGPDDITTAEPSEPASGAHRERAPRRPRTTRAGLGGRLRAGRGAKKGKPKKRAPRVPVDRLAGMAWEGFGRLFAPVSLPVGRTLQLQAPIAGMVLEDIIRDTAADRFVQPLARNMEKGRKLYALAGPPAIVFALELAQQLPPDQKAIREAFLVPMLMESLMAWDDVAGDKLEESIARQADDGPRRERAERIVQMIFTPPVPPTGPTADDEAAARAQQMAGAAM